MPAVCVCLNNSRCRPLPPDPQEQTCTPAAAHTHDAVELAGLPRESSHRHPTPASNTDAEPGVFWYSYPPPRSAQPKGVRGHDQLTVLASVQGLIALPRLCQRPWRLALALGYLTCPTTTSRPYPPQSTTSQPSTHSTSPTTTSLVRYRPHATHTFPACL